MARSFIGIDIDANKLRMISLAESGSEMQITALAQRKVEDLDDAVEAIAAILEEWDASNARLAMAVPAEKVLSRHLVFPFGDRKKIAAAVPLELGSRLPKDLSEHYITSLPPIARESNYSTIGFALPQELMTSTLAPFDERQLPLRYLGISPFTFTGQFSEQPESCILLAIRTGEISTLLIVDGEPVSHRNTIRNKNQSISETLTQINRDVVTLQKTAGHEELPVLMFGPGLDADLQRGIATTLATARVPDEFFEGNKLLPEFLPALALARQVATPARSCNLRQGKFAFRGSLAPFKKQLIAAAVLLAITLTTFAGGAWLSYARKATVADKLQTQMEKIYSQTFPGAGDPPKDIPLHMTSRLNAARNQSQLLGGPGMTPLATLEAITRALPEGSSSLVKELSYDKDGIQLAGQANSFDAVDQLTAGLNKESSFGSARISDAKTNIDGKRIDFRIDLEFAGKGGQR